MRTDDEEFVRRFFASSVPRDVVPGSGMTRQDYLAQNAAAGTWAEVVISGAPVCDPDGTPIGMTEPTKQTVYRGPTVVTRAELAKVGLTPADVPNLVIEDIE